MGNTLFSPTSGELAALIDWELSTIGDPLLDLGWVMATCPWAHEHGGLDIRPSDGFPSIAELIAHYRAHSDRDLSSLQWYAVLACYKLGAILEGTYARACAGRADNSIGDDLHKMTLALFRRGHRWIQGGIPTMN
jgi:aminoglycoside phosphotransferase (APT) family kinase protein